MKPQHLFFQLIILFILFSCNTKRNNTLKVRNPVDSVGFPVYSYQVDSFMQRVKNLYFEQIKTNNSKELNWKAAIVPHDDYAYVQDLYPKILKNVKAKTIFMIGVAHKARILGLQDKILFGTFDYWNAPYGKVKVSGLRDTIMNMLDKKLYLISDSMQSIEHSLEPFLPILQYYDNDFEIIPVLIPYMAYNKMKEIAKLLSAAIYQATINNKMEWGKDFTILISTDAVHYGDEDWGGKNFARFGTDSIGYKKAIEYEHEIINNCLLGELKPDKIEKFTKYTVNEQDYKEYKWTWCGRYSVPFGLLSVYYLQELHETRLNDKFIGYSNSIAKPTLYLEDIGMGVTAPANIHHWVGYCAIGYY